MKVLAAIGGETFADNNELGQLNGWSNTGNSATDTPANLPGVLSTPWFKVAPFQSLTRNFLTDALVADVNGQRNIEHNFAFHNVDGAGSAGVLGEIRVNNGSTSLAVRAEVRQDPDTLLFNKIFLGYSSEASGTSFIYVDTGVAITDGFIAFCTMRLLSESAFNATDGAVQLSINGVDTFVENLTFRDGVGHMPDGYPVICNVQGRSGFDIYYRNLYITDTFSSPIGQPPIPVFVYDHLATTVIATDYTNEGGAADMPTAVSDSDDATYLETTVQDATASFGFTIPVDVESNIILGLVLAIRASRANGAFNNIEIELRNGDGNTTIETVTKSINVIDPSRERVTHSFDAAQGLDHDGFTFVIRNDPSV